MESNLTEKYLYQDECHKIIGACYEVHNFLGHGFLESVYQEALSIEFMKSRIPFEAQKKLDVWFKDVKLEKSFYADFLCYGKIIIELKAMDGLVPEHIAQVLNYLKATKLNLGLLINFGASKVQIKRVIL